MTGREIDDELVAGCCEFYDAEYQFSKEEPDPYPSRLGAFDRILTERNMLQTKDDMLRESLAWLADMASVLHERFASVSAVANIQPLSSNEWLDQALEHGFHEVKEARDDR